MTKSKRRMVPAVVAGALGFGAMVGVASADTRDLQQQVADLQAKIAAMESHQRPDTKAVDATVDALVQDAQKRTHMLAAVASGAGVDDMGFFISGNNFEFRPTLGLMFRYTANWGNDRKNGGNEISDGFEVTRARVGLAGYAFDARMKYNLLWNAGDIAGGVSLLDAMVQYQVADQYAIKFGQFIDPIYHGANISEFSQVAADRSLTLSLLGFAPGIASRVQGVGLVWGGDKDAMKAEVLYHDGVGSGNSPFQNAGANWGAAARVEFKAMGDWKAYADFTARGTVADLLVIGGGLDISEGDNQTTYRFTVDGQYENGAGLGAFAAFYGLVTDARGAAGDDTLFDWGGEVQVSFMVNPQWEVFARAGIVVLDDDRNAEDDVFELTAGVNYYLFGKPGSTMGAKVTVDITWLPNGAPGAQPYLNILGGTDQDEILLRGQFVLTL